MPDRDPKNLEMQFLAKYADLRDKNILEIGAGDGRLTWRYADQCRNIVAVDPLRTSLITARQTCPPQLQSKITFLNADAVQLPFAKHSFEGAILAWSL